MISNTRVLRALVLVLFAALATSLARGQDEGHGAEDAKPKTFWVDLYVIDLAAIRGAEQAYTADVYLMVRWRDSRLANPGGEARHLSTGEIWMPSIQIIGERKAWKRLPEIVEVDPTGLVTYRQRYFGDFTSRLDLREFPTDSQTIRMQVVLAMYDADEIELVLDESGLSGMAEEPSIPDWEVKSWRFSPEPYTIGKGVREVAGVAFEIDVRRHVTYYVYKVFLPISLILFMSWIVFWVKPDLIGPQISVSVTSMLTLIAYMFLLGNILPKLSYLTRLDHLMLGTTLLVFGALVEVALTSMLVGHGRLELARKVDWGARALFPVAYVLLFLGTILT